MFQKASFNSNRDIKRNILGDVGDAGYGNGPQNNTSHHFSKNGRELNSILHKPYNRHLW